MNLSSHFEETPQTASSTVVETLVEIMRLPLTMKTREVVNQVYYSKACPLPLMKKTEDTSVNSRQYKFQKEQRITLANKLIIENTG